MKTYQKTITAPRLEIWYDNDSENPRLGSLGWFITCDKRHSSPDNSEELKSLIQNAGEESANQAEHIKNIEVEIEANGYGKVLAIYPIVKHDHGGVSYSRGTSHGFDDSNNGFYIITEKTLKISGVKKKLWTAVIDDELKIYNAWANGEIYGYTLYDENGEQAVSVGGFYDLESIQDELPAEWKDEKLTEYMTQS